MFFKTPTILKIDLKFPQLENSLLGNEELKAGIPDMLADILHNLNTSGTCSLPLSM